MKFYSTRNKSLRYDLDNAILEGLAPDGGLFMPESFSKLDSKNFGSFPETAFEGAKQIVDGAIPDNELKAICEDAFNFDVPLVKISESIYMLELFHGPTLAFKDFGARFMARMVAALKPDTSKLTTVIVATSGDTGGAVANGFYYVPGIKVVLLYPKGKVSPLQEKQLTTLGGNITAVEVDGTFDDCQSMVKESFSDPEISEKLNLTAANSINIARLIPQMLYFMHAVHSLNKKDLVFSIPSGNFGNLTAGVFAKRLGLPVKKFLAATNINDAVPSYLQSGEFEPKPSVRTISNAMDVGAASNFERLMDLYDNSLEKIRMDLAGFSFSDDQTKQRMKKLYDETGYVIDPHGAVGLLASDNWLNDNPEDTVVLFGTAHPSKFIEVVESTLGFAPEIPKQLADLQNKKKVVKSCGNKFNEFREILLNN